MHRPVVQLVAGLGVMIALAIFDLGPRANAAYQSVAGAGAPTGIVLADDNSPSDRSPDQTPQTEPDLLRNQTSGGSTTPAPTTSPGGNSPPAGLPHLTDTPSPSLVAYFREPPGLLDPSHFIASILDPPRAA